jgi:hypothetical protein
VTALVRQFDRFVSATIIPANGPGVLVNPYVPGVPLPTPNAIRITATIEKSVSAEANRAEVTVYNLGPFQRDRVAGVSRQTYTLGDLVPITGITRAQRNRVLASSGALDPIVITSVDGFATLRLEAGYQGAIGVVFDGVCETAVNETDGIDWRSTLRTSDASLAISRAITDATPVVAGTTAAAYIASLAAQMGLSVGSLAATNLLGYTFPRTYVPGPVRCRDELNELLGALECEWWIEDSTLYAVNFGEPLPLPPVTLSNVGDVVGLMLLERPRQAEGGGLEVKTLLAPNLQLGRAVNVITADVAGAYRVDGLVHSIDNRGGEFSTTARLTSLAPLGGILE